MKFQTEKTVEVDEDKVVDGGAEQNNFQRGHHVTHYWTKTPPGNIFINQELYLARSSSSSLPPISERVDGDDEPGHHVRHGQRDNHQAESLSRVETVGLFRDILIKTWVRHFSECLIVKMSKLLASIIKPATMFLT